MIIQNNNIKQKHSPRCRQSSAPSARTRQFLSRPSGTSLRCPAGGLTSPYRHLHQTWPCC